MGGPQSFGQHHGRTGQAELIAFEQRSAKGWNIRDLDNLYSVYILTFNAFQRAET